ncbi:unnamed protein product [Urochloa humidicola]
MATPHRASPYCLLLLLVVAFLLHHRVAAESRPVGEAELLLQIKRTWGDPPALAAWGANASTAGAHCRWPYIGCDSTGRVTKLALANANITGAIPDAVGGLSSLTHLDVSNNSITAGVFPTALYHCRSLRYINLSGNNIGGELPSDIEHRLGANLSTLDLGGNEFRWHHPGDLVQAPKASVSRAGRQLPHWHYTDGAWQADEP